MRRRTAVQISGDSRRTARRGGLRGLLAPDRSPLASDGAVPQIEHSVFCAFSLAGSGFGGVLLAWRSSSHPRPCVADPARLSAALCRRRLPVHRVATTIDGGRLGWSPRSPPSDCRKRNFWLFMPAYRTLVKRYWIVRLSRRGPRSLASVVVCKR